MIATWETSLTFDDSERFEMSMEETAEFETGLKEVNEVVSTDHSKLMNRDKEDQHPIKAITDLSLQLSKKINTSEALTNMEIEALLGG